MSNYKLKLGKEGEQIATSHLNQKGYQILERNFRHGRSEIDIIAELEDVLVFVEVKTRETDKFGEPELAVSTAKKNKLAEGAEGYLIKNNKFNSCRYDVISIIKNQYKTELHHIEDAFWPGLY